MLGDRPGSLSGAGVANSCAQACSESAANVSFDYGAYGLARLDEFQRLVELPEYAVIGPFNWTHLP